MISFFDTGTWVDGADYGYTPEHTEKEKRIENQRKIIIDENTGEEEVKYEDVEIEVDVVVPAKWREDCIHVEYVDLPPGTRPILEQTKKGYKVTFEPIEIAEEAPPEKPTSDNETL